jgi:spoIIIJ-associated protein
VEWVVTTGRSVAEAVESALDQLGVDEQDADVEVVQEPQRGLFGRLRAEARVRARVRPTAPRPKVDRRDRRRTDKRGRDGERGRTKGTTGTAGQAREPRQSRGDIPGEARRGDGASPAAVAVTQTDETARAARPADSSRARRRRRRGGRPAEGAAVVSESTQSADSQEARDFDIDGQRQAVEAFLTELIAAFGRSDAAVTVGLSDDEAIDAAVEGSELGLLVGHKGATLQAVQELVRSMLQRRFVGQTHARVRVDVAGYRARRKVALERFARQVAEGVKVSGTAKALDPMGSADRKIVHDVVNEIDGVTTVSEGEDMARRVVIRPG